MDEMRKRIKALPKNIKWWGTEACIKFALEWEETTKSLNSLQADLSKIRLSPKKEDDI